MKVCLDTRADYGQTSTRRYETHSVTDEHVCVTCARRAGVMSDGGDPIQHHYSVTMTHSI